MCDFGIVSGSIALGLGLAGGIADAVGSANQGAAEDKRAQQNARIAEQAAADALARGEKDVGQVKTQTGNVIGEQRAQYAEGGAVVSSGTAADVQAATAAQGKLEELVTRNNAYREAWGFKNQATEYRLAGSEAKSAGEARAAGSLLATGGRALAGAADVYKSSRDFGLKKR